MQRQLSPLLLFILFTAFYFADTGILNAQERQVETSAEISGILSSDGSTPFWLQSNRSGVAAPDGSHFYSRFQLHGSDELFGPVSVYYGADLVARPGTASTLHFNQGYLKFRAYGLELAGGRFTHSSPDYPVHIGMGSLGVSGNATPVPQIRAGIPEWTPLPFTREFVEIRATVAHGWLGSNRYTENVLYHEKIGHAKFGGDLPLNLFGGIHHFVKWGGENHPRHGDLPSSFTDFWRVFFALGGDDDAPRGEQAYMLGDHLGAWEFGFTLEAGLFNLRAYRQFPLETKDNLKLKSPQDALMGFHFRFSERFPLPVTELVYEHLYTKWQDGPRRENTIDGVPCSELPPGTCRDSGQGQENYYNHSIYRTGWVYNSNVIGNPLFIRHPDNLGVINNRIVGHHIGIVSQLHRVQLTTRATYSRNYGTWSRPFDSRKDQWSFAAGVETPLIMAGVPATLLLETAWDHGDLVGNRFGMMMGLMVVR